MNNPLNSIAVIPVIAIDGPSASGKGTVAMRVAAELGWHYLDSGALYRLTALALSEQGLEQGRTPDTFTEAEIATIASQLDIVFLEGAILLNGENATEAIRTENIGKLASVVAALPSIRTALLQLQRNFLRPPGLVADGRDMGSVVFSNAPLKVFLTASAEERAARRYKQLITQLIDTPESVTMQQILHDIELRDLRDSARAVAPLKQLSDAHLLDTTALTIEQTVQKILDWWQTLEMAE